jgi:hypothetical protein
VFRKCSGSISKFYFVRSLTFFLSVRQGFDSSALRMQNLSGTGGQSLSRLFRSSAGNDLNQRVRSTVFLPVRMCSTTLVFLSV